MKKKNAVMLILYCVPWIFLTLYIDETYHMAWQYGLVLAVMAAGAGVLKDNGRLLLFGNMISFCVSMLLVRLLGYDEMNHYFKPFTAYGWVTVLTTVSGIIQMLVWKKKHPQAC